MQTELQAGASQPPLLCRKDAGTMTTCLTVAGAIHELHVRRWMFRQRRLTDCVRAYPFFFLRRKKNGKKRKSCKGDAPLTPAEGSDTTTVCGSSGEGSVQVAQCGQGGVQVIKRSAANTFFGFPFEGKAKSGRAARTADERFLPRIPKLSPL